MRLKAGWTRCVLLVGSNAIKVPHFASFLVIPIHVVKALMPQHRAWRNNRMGMYANGRSFFWMLCNYLAHIFFGGIQANRQEYRISRNHPGLPIAHVKAAYFWCFILVMERGEPVTSAVSERLRRQFRCGGFCDLDQAKHVCAFGKKLKFIDYGHSDVPRIFGIT